MDTAIVEREVSRHHHSRVLELELREGAHGEGKVISVAQVVTGFYDCADNSARGRDVISNLIRKAHDRGYRFATYKDWRGNETHPGQ